MWSATSVMHLHSSFGWWQNEPPVEVLHIGRAVRQQGFSREADPRKRHQDWMPVEKSAGVEKCLSMFKDTQATGKLADLRVPSSSGIASPPVGVVGASCEAGLDWSEAQAPQVSEDPCQQSDQHCELCGQQKAAQNLRRRCWHFALTGLLSTRSGYRSASKTISKTCCHLLSAACKAFSGSCAILLTSSRRSACRSNAPLQAAEQPSMLPANFLTIQAMQSHTASHKCLQVLLHLNA